jgi:hypothetical protein
MRILRHWRGHFLAVGARGLPTGRFVATSAEATGQARAADSAEACAVPELAI